jgi:hypothetical protein
MELAINQRDKLPWFMQAGQLFRNLLAKQEAAIIIPFFLLLAFFYWRNEAMLSGPTIVSILRTMAFPALISMGMVQLMIAGEIDLSTGSQIDARFWCTAARSGRLFARGGVVGRLDQRPVDCQGWPPGSDHNHRHGLYCARH